MGDCIFCKIVKKEIPAKICAESSKTIAFHDINPQSPVHILIIPKEHIPGLLDLQSKDSVTINEMMESAQKLAKIEGIDKSGFRLVINSGQDAGQAVDHLHLHLLGRRKLGWPPG